MTEELLGHPGGCQFQSKAEELTQEVYGLRNELVELRAEKERWTRDKASLFDKIIAVFKMSSMAGNRLCDECEVEDSFLICGTCIGNRVGIDD